MEMNALKVMSYFVESDHYAMGLDKGKTRDKIMKYCGYEGPGADTPAGYRDRARASACINNAKKRFEAEGLTLDSLKLKGKPTVYFLVIPGSEERARYHDKLVKRASNSQDKVKVSRLTITQELEKLPAGAKTRKLLTEALSKRV